MFEPLNLQSHQLRLLVDRLQKRAHLGARRKLLEEGALPLTETLDLALQAGDVVGLSLHLCPLILGLRDALLRLRDGVLQAAVDQQVEGHDHAR